MKLQFRIGYWLEDTLYNIAAEHINTTGRVLYNSWEIVAEQNRGRLIYDLKFWRIL